MKKLIAQISAMALLLALVVVPKSEAAGVAITVTSTDRQTFTIGLPAGVDLATGEAATVRLTTTATGAAVDLTGNQVTAGYFVVDGNSADTLTNAGDANGYIVITEDGVEDPAAGEDLTFTLTSALATDTAYTIAYRDDAGNYGAAMINFGTSNQVTVTARVEPILTFDLDTSAIALGTLAAGTTATGAVVATTATNAANGVTVSMAASGLATGNTASDTHIGALANSGSTATTPADDTYQVESTTTAGGTALGNQDVASTQNVLTAADITEANADTTVTIKATAQATTEAGDYTDTLVFSVTATY